MDNEIFVLMLFFSGSDDIQVMIFLLGYLEVIYRMLNLLIDYFFNFDDDDGYLIFVFDFRKNDFLD